MPDLKNMSYVTLWCEHCYALLPHCYGYVNHFGENIYFCLECDKSRPLRREDNEIIFHDAPVG